MTKKTLTFFSLHHLEYVIKAKIPVITSLINKGVDDMEAKLDHLGRPIAVDAGVIYFYLVQFTMKCGNFYLVQFTMKCGITVSCLPKFYLSGSNVHYLRTLSCF
ncbi:hypothetical protein L6452_37358 [Arctium lappa]|uniref:Uncharacterized protein n=1 Tax=Arctium lappa TaxID=4217 RepID=A0ACB8Y3W9_ARCLA|nr:hypothetical protein L6452_37358 [Arctium lappa]